MIALLAREGTWRYGQFRELVAYLFLSAINLLLLVSTNAHCLHAS